MSDNSQNIAAQLAEAEQRVSALRAQLQQAQSKGSTAAAAAPGAPAKQPGTMRMAADMGARAAQGQAFVDEDRMLHHGQRDHIQQALRLRMQQLANPGASPMQLDLQRRASAMPPTVTPGAAAAWQQAQPGQPSPEDWNDPWKYSGG